MKRSVSVKVAGQNLRLTTDDDEDYVRSIAQSLDERVRDLRQKLGSTSVHQVSLLVGLQLVDEVLKLREALASFEGEVQTRVANVIELLQQDA